MIMDFFSEQEEGRGREPWKQQEQLGDYDSADLDRLIKTAQSVFTRFPAGRYGLVLWSHGTGWGLKETEKINRLAGQDETVDFQVALDEKGESH
jgi:hypothetical protein